VGRKWEIPTGNYMRRVVIKCITTELALRFASEQRRFFTTSSLESITTVILENSYDLVVNSRATLNIDSLTLMARLLSYRNQNPIIITDSNNSKDFILICLQIVIKLKSICLSDDFSILVKSIIRGLDSENNYETVSFLEYLAITGLHESVPFQFLWNSLDDQITSFGIPEHMIYYDLEGEVCLLTELDLSILAQLEKLS
jgi:hypothetical protein